MLVYQPPSTPKPFILPEASKDKAKASVLGLKDSDRQLDVLLRYSRRLKSLMEKTAKVLKKGNLADEADGLNIELKALEQQRSELSPILLAYSSTDAALDASSISTSLEENKVIINSLYQLPLNKDVVIRNLCIPTALPMKAMLVFMDGLIDKKIINLNVLQPLMLLGKSNPSLKVDSLAAVLIETYLPSGQATRVDNFRAVQDAVNSGDAVLFLEGIDQAVTLETKGFEHRGIDRPTTEQSVRGSQNSFTEVLRVNTGLIRSMLRASDLVTEMIPVGKRGYLNCAVMYLQTVVNPALVDEVRRRIQGISTDYIGDSGILEHFIVDFPYNPFPQTISTERPDRIVAHLVEGRVGILLDGSPFGHVVPVSFFSLMHSSDDFSLNLYYSNMLRIVRYIGAFLSLLLPALYLAISTFHSEAIPTELLLSIIAARSQVPFPTIFEILLMELSFELIREGGLRIPGILGSTIGIVGAIILGQAAVSAKLVSPIMVIIIAVTGLASYTIPEYRLAAAFRLLRFGYILLGLVLGLVGIACGFVVMIAILCSMKSFGMPYMAPLAPRTGSFHGDVILRSQSYQQEFRPDALNSQDNVRQAKHARKWIKQPPSGGDHS